MTHRSLFAGILAALALMFLLATGFTASAQTKPTLPSLKVTADRADALYRQGDTVTFTIHLVDAPADAEVKWTTTKDGVPPRHSGTAKLVNGQATVTATLGEPGFILCEAVYFYPESDAAGAKTKTVKALAAQASTRFRSSPACRSPTTSTTSGPRRKRSSPPSP